MDQDLQEKLVRKHRRVLDGCYDLDVGDGWYELIDKMLTELAKYPIKMKQIKEKFGGLRAYYTSDDNCDIEIDDDTWFEVDDIIAEAEEKAWHTCEICGEHGSVGSNGWISTLCPSCREFNSANA